MDENRSFRLGSKLSKDILSKIDNISLLNAPKLTYKKSRNNIPYFKLETESIEQAIIETSTKSSKYINKTFVSEHLNSASYEVTYQRSCRLEKSILKAMNSIKKSKHQKKQGFDTLKTSKSVSILDFLKRNKANLSRGLINL